MIFSREAVDVKDENAREVYHMEFGFDVGFNFRSDTVRFGIIG